MNFLEPYELIKKLREEQGLKQLDVAKAIDMNISVYNKIESGVRPIRDNELIALSGFFGVSADYILGKTSKKYWELTTEEEKDIAKQIENIINQTENEADINFYGEPITEEDRGLLANALEIGLRLSKETAKKNQLKKDNTKKEED